MRKQCLKAIICAAALTTAHAENSYQLVKEIPLGGEGGWDFLSIDGAARRFYVTHDMKIIVMDLRNDAVAGEIAGTPGVHGFAIAHDLGRGFASNGRESKVSVVDLKTLRTLAKVPDRQES